MNKWEKLQIDSEDDKSPDEKPISDLSSTIPKGTDKSPPVLGEVLKDVPDRWKNWIIRGIFTWLMIGGFCVIIYGGPLALMVTVCS